MFGSAKSYPISAMRWAFIIALNSGDAYRIHLRSIVRRAFSADGCNTRSGLVEELLASVGLSNAIVSFLSLASLARMLFEKEVDNLVILYAPTMIIPWIYDLSSTTFLHRNTAVPPLFSYGY